jgi:arylsulfatase A-like enzyme
LSAALCQAAAGQRPNVILVITDDQGYGDISAHGNTMLKTPNLDQLHAQSVRLTDFHVDPTCSPTRSALMTGRYSTRTGVWHTIAGRSLMNTAEVTLAEVFAANGYDTALFGKWHLGDNYPLRPQDQGFQKCLYLGGGGVTQTPDWWGNDYFDDTYRREDGSPVECQGYCTDVWFDRALQFIETHRQRPFFCYLATNAPHGPYLVAEDDKRPYIDAGVREPMASFYGMIANIDDNFGRLTRRLDERQLADNTILIFMTDNGTAAGVASGRRGGESSGWRGFGAGMRGQKGAAYEGGHRVPFFIRWPAGGIAGARDVQGLAAHIDVLPTLMELCNLKRPEGPLLDGMSLAAALRGESGQLPDRTLFVHSQRIEYPEKWRNSSVMTNRWRLINGRELYDQSADPGQERDLAAEQPQVMTELRAKYERWWQSLTPAFDQYVAITIGADEESPVHLTCHDWHAENVPWSQSAVERDPPANGYWMVNVSRSGRYEFTLRMRPEPVKYPLPAGTARVRVGDVERQQTIVDGATETRIVLKLEKGTAQLQTWLESGDGTSRGAYFVDVKRLSE